MGSNGPPLEVPPSELWARLSVSGRPHELVDFPRKDPETGEPLGKVAIWPLTQGELIVSKAEATKYARLCIKEKFDATERVEGYMQAFEDACASEMIFRFCRRPENVLLPTFPSAAKVREKLTGDECSVLVNAYALIQVKLGPIVATMDVEDYEAWVSRLKVGGAAQLAFLSWEGRTALMMHMVDRLVSLQTDKSSAGKPQDESPPNDAEMTNP